MILDVVVLCLALNGYFEGRSEPIEGQLAINEVTLKRASISGRTVCEEVFTDKQFSWTSAPKPQVTNNKAWQQALFMANASLTLLTDYAKGATHYHAIRWKGKLFPKPKWALQLCETTRIGNHVFYKACGELK